MYQLKKLVDVDKNAKIKHSIVLGIELCLSIASLGLLIYYLCIGDPNKRMWPTIGSIAIFLVPLLLELIFRVRFSMMAHLLFTIHVTLSIFMGCALNFHNSVGPYDEIMHFIFGYMACMLFYFIMISWKDYHSQGVLFPTIFIVLASLGTATFWEILEFSMDILLGQTSLGHPDPAIIEQGIALGKQGIALNIYAISHGVNVWDTITDMTLHLGGSVLFTIEYLIHRKVHLPFLSFIERDYQNNKKSFYKVVDSSEVTTQDDIVTLSSDDTTSLE